jgi:hypothetical protein
LFPDGESAGGKHLGLREIPAPACNRYKACRCGCFATATGSGAKDQLIGPPVQTVRLIQVVLSFEHTAEPEEHRKHSEAFRMIFLVQGQGPFELLPGLWKVTALHERLRPIHQETRFQASCS